MVKIHLSFFPNDITEAEIRALVGLYIHAETVKIIRSRLPRRTIAIVGVDLSPIAANYIADKLDQHVHEGRALKATTLLH